MTAFYKMIVGLVTLQSICFAGVDLTSSQGQTYIGHQLQSFHVEPGGSIVADKDAWINLYYSENRRFKLSGEVWLGGPSKTLDHPGDLPDGFTLFLREFDSLHRYAVNSRFMTVKRRLHDGRKEKGIVNLVSFPEPPKGRWLPFKLTADENRTTFQIGTNSGVITGPFDMDGANKIALASGSKLKNVELEILDEPPAAVANVAVSPKPSNPPTAPAGLQIGKAEDGTVGLSVHGESGRVYQLEFTSNLAAPAWTPLRQITNSTETVKISPSADQPQGFYRVVPDR